MAADDLGARRIPPGSCTWCGHAPHRQACPATIRTRDADASPCPCVRHERMPQ